MEGAPLRLKLWSYFAGCVKYISLESFSNIERRRAMKIRPSTGHFPIVSLDPHALDDNFYRWFIHPLILSFPLILWRYFFFFLFFSCGRSWWYRKCTEIRWTGTTRRANPPSPLNTFCNFSRAVSCLRMDWIRSCVFICYLEGRIIQLGCIFEHKDLRHFTLYCHWTLVKFCSFLSYPLKLLQIEKLQNYYSFVAFVLHIGV